MTLSLAPDFQKRKNGLYNLLRDLDPRLPSAWCRNDDFTAVRLYSRAYTGFPFLLPHSNTTLYLTQNTENPNLPSINIE